MLMRLKKLTFSLCILGFSVSTLAQTVLVKSDHNIEEYKLENGFRVLLAPNDKENKVFMNTVYLTGSLNDPQGKGGLAHLLEHLAFKGTQDVKGEEFQRRLDQYTLMTNASTDYYSTKYTNIIRPDQNILNEVIYLESQRMDKLVLQEKFVPSEINIVMREREVRMDQPFAVLMDQMWKAAYGNQSLGRLPIGDLSELQSIKMSELNKFYKDWYAPNNAVMVISGKFDKAEVLKAIDKNFSPISARQIPQQAQVPLLDSAKIKNRDFTVKKGSDLAKFNIYMNGKNEKIQPALALAPYLYTLQPSGHLYSSMVETGIATNVQSTTWLDDDFNLVFMGAIYAPNHDAKKIDQSLISGVEQNPSFNDVELKRVKNLIQNAHDNLMSSATAVGGMLSDYVVTSHGDWAQYFKDQQRIQNLTVNETNSTLKSFFTQQHRFHGDIQPTPEDQKKALEQKQATEKPKTLDQQAAAVEPLKDVSVYQAEVAQYVQQSKQYLEATEKKIQRGTLKNGMQYALFPTSTRDDKTYATIEVNFGTAEALKNKSQILDFMAYLLLRASEQYSLQNIADKTIEAGGDATAAAIDNGITIQISAKKEKFEDFFKYIVSVMKNPKFEQSQFDLIKLQSLSSLDRPYTEPETVSSLTIARLLETYQPGDLRYHFEPELAKQQIQAATNQQVIDLYKKYFAMDHGFISVTGQYDAKAMQKLLNQQFGNWTGKQPYQRLSTEFNTYKAQKVHALSEQREFGSYQALQTLPVGVDNKDAAALIVFSYILGDSQLSSRLGQELREKNALVYGFGSQLNLDSFNDAGALSIEANYTAGKSAEVSQVVRKVLQDLLTTGVTSQELEAAKANIMKQRVTSLEDERIIHRMLNSQLERNKKMDSRGLRDQEFAKLTKADVDAAIKKYIKPEQLVEVMADQYGQAQKGIN
ncbi:insulinase family protein [Acinetobacter bereziniae]|uniref:M16 family metallopeptidase n=1 Tax=Acinetobacter bereziniae TaxID=106648 RepID=UPI0012509962|nr:pitrilysin family protein [Acinetobacter bereziniae]NUF61708.1 insulinase family protein [Acinetobacter bereziniae]NUG08618.1 insulinase family protein [Acinetobacter bereziniae]NUG62875.1 insulinase family protein [Acinetobacter bereziniae]NUG69418.1 insulinase family protein [Acinetobacter bereziniae]NUG81310.1 insulinase family protein [Acinetobacter bereziniae]